MSHYYTYYGQPILSPNSDSIWAYWAVNNQYHQPTVQFNTESALLGQNFYNETLKYPRNTFVSKESNYIWKASEDCIQQDFKECHLFFCSDFTGPDVINKAINTLINDDRFKNHFKGVRTYGNLSFIDELKEYININNILLHN